MRALLDLVVPAECVVCHARGAVVCRPCAAVLDLPARPAWPQPSPPDLPPPYAVATYAGDVRTMLLAFKERGVVGLQRVLGVALATSVRAALADGPSGPVWLVPVPSSRAASRERGDDVVLRLARQAARTCRAHGYDVRVLPVLRHNRAVRDSAGLSAAARAANLSGAFVVVPHLRHHLSRRTVVLVDDLVTTGATLAESALALRRAGADVAAAATVAATGRHSRLVRPGLHKP